MIPTILCLRGSGFEDPTQARSWEFTNFGHTTILYIYIYTLYGNGLNYTSAYSSNVVYDFELLPFTSFICEWYNCLFRVESKGLELVQGV